MSFGRLRHVPEDLPELPRDYHDFDRVHVPGYGSASCREVAYLHQLRYEGVTHLDAEHRRTLRELEADEMHDAFSAELPAQRPSTHVAERSGRLAWFARFVGLPAFGVLILVALLYLVISRSSEQDASNEAGTADVVASVPAQLDPAEPPDSSPAPTPGLAAEPTISADTADAGGNTNAAEAADAPASATPPAGDSSTRFVGEFVPGPITSTVAVEDGSVELELVDDSQLDARLEFGLVYAEEFACGTVDEFSGDAVFELSGGVGTTRVELTRFFPACADPGLAEEVLVDAVARVVVGDGEVTGDVVLFDEFVVVWEARPVG